MPYPLTLAIGDVHAPWTVWRTLYKIIEYAEAKKPKHIVQLGDLYDMYSWTRFARTQNLYTPRQELKHGRRVAETLWAKLRKAAPRAKLWQLRGNHDVRPHKKVMGAAPECEDLILGVDALWQFDNVETILDPRETLELGGVVYTHGFRKHGEHVLQTHRNTVVGHLHVGGTVYVRHGQKTLWELNAGFCGNPDAVPLSYTQLRKYGKTTQGFAAIDDAGPRFIHLPNP